MTIHDPPGAGGAELGEVTNAVKKKPTTDSAPTGPPKRPEFLRIVATIKDFFTDMATAIEPLADPNSSAEVSRFISEMVKDNAVRSRLPLFVAGTSFATLTSALAKLNEVATRSITPHITSAAYGRIPDQTDKPTGPQGAATTTPQGTETPAHTPYLLAARSTPPPRPLRNLPVTDATRSAPTLANDAMFTRSFR